jgi:tRNA 2-selenouridine synthase SelU
MMSEDKKFTIICPCCEATLTVDAQTGAILAHAEKQKIHGSFEDLKGELEKQKQVRENIFAQELGSMKDRERLLEEKFKEAMKRAGDDKDTPFHNPMDLD